MRDEVETTPRVVLVAGRNPFNAADVLRGMSEAAVTERVAIDLQDATALPAKKGSGVFFSIAPEGIDPRWWGQKKDSRPLYFGGVVMMRVGEGVWEAVREWGGPAVVLFDHSGGPEFPVVVPDEREIGARAAEHLLERGHRRLAFLGYGAVWSELRREGFEAVVRRAGAAVVGARVSGDWMELTSAEALGEWAGSLPTPVGVFCANDPLAVGMRSACGSVGRRVPEDVAIVGVDNDELLTRYGAVPLTSVGLNAKGVGAEALRLMARWLRTGERPAGVTVVPAGPLVARRSSDAPAVDDPEVAVAVRFIAERFAEGIDVGDVVGRVLLSRGTLDRRMKRALGRSCAEEIERVKLSHARRLLLETDLPLTRIAPACGYAYLSHFSHAFRSATGVPPSRWRERERGR